MSSSRVLEEIFSTDTCLIHLLDYIRDNNSKGLFTGMIMLDLQKAFDTVDHEILCNKLSCMGVEAKWFKSYLTGRSQVVGCWGPYQMLETSHVESLKVVF